MEELFQLTNVENKTCVSRPSFGFGDEVPAAKALFFHLSIS